MERDGTDESKEAPLERVFGLQARKLNRSTIAIVFSALFLLTSCGVVSQLGAAHLIAFWMVFGVLLAVVGILWRFKLLPG